METQLPIHAVAVAWRAPGQKLLDLLGALLGQVQRIHLIHNGAPEEWPLEPSVLPAQAAVVHLGTNTGLANAQNVGLRHALKAGASHVLLLDQDSLPEPGMVSALLRGLGAAEAAGIRLAAVGPALLADGAEGGASGFVRTGLRGYFEIHPTAQQAWVCCDVLFSSGMLIPAPVLHQVGLMDETLFIDKIDTDWCLRAAATGLQVAGVPAARMLHRVGSSARTVGWGFFRREVVQHAPWRCYTQVRNSLWLCRRPHANARFVLSDLRQTLLLALWLGLLSPQRALHAPWIWRGLKAGLGPGYRY